MEFQVCHQNIGGSGFCGKDTQAFDEPLIIISENIIRCVFDCC